VKKAKSLPANTVSELEITAPKASGKVWVNTESGVYHKSGQWYGATKQRKFMTEQAGYRPQNPSSARRFDRGDEPASPLAIPKVSSVLKTSFTCFAPTVAWSK
jgi:hypothetical protein